MYFLIILSFLVLSTIVATIRFPNFKSRLTSKLPRFKFSKWFTNPKIKKHLQDREFFNKNVSQILTGPLFVIIGEENYKIYNLFAQKDSYGVTKNFESSEEAFDILEYQGAKLLFIHPKLVITEKDDLLSTRMRLLVERIAKNRRKNFIDGIVILPKMETFKKSDTPPSKELANEVNYCANAYQTFANFFKVKIPLYFIAHDTRLKQDISIKNIFKHDPITENDNAYIGFSTDFSKKSADSKLYDFFQNMLSVFFQAFNKKTNAILHESVLGSNGISGVNIAFHVQEDIFLLSKNYVSFFLKHFDAVPEIEFSRVAILNSALFASYEGSSPAESIKNLFYYLAQNGKDKLEFSQKFLNHRRRANIWFLVWTMIFAGSGLFVVWRTHQYLYKKRIEYINNSIAVYNDFGKKFNQVLSNKYPFATPTVTQNARFENIASISKDLQTILKSKQSYFFEHVDTLTDRKDIKTFLDEMQLIAIFFNLKNIDDKSLPTTFQLGVGFDFRLHPQTEYLANRIVDWSLTIGKDSYGSKYGAQKRAEFLWHYGDPLMFKLEFFTKEHKNYDQSLTPQKTLRNTQIQSNERMYVQGDTVVFAYPNDPWSLLRFIQDHDICPSVNASCPEALLQFMIPLANQSNVVFFCGLELQGIDEKALTVPIFPKTAPLFTKNVD